MSFSCILPQVTLSLHRVFHSIRFKVTKGWVKALTLFLYIYIIQLSQVELLYPIGYNLSALSASSASKK